MKKYTNSQQKSSVLLKSGTPGQIFCCNIKRSHKCIVLQSLNCYLVPNKRQHLVPIKRKNTKITQTTHCKYIKINNLIAIWYPTNARLFFAYFLAIIWYLSNVYLVPMKRLFGTYETYLVPNKRKIKCNKINHLIAIWYPTNVPSYYSLLNTLLRIAAYKYPSTWGWVK